MTSNTVIVKRGFTTDFENHAGLIHSITRKCMGRLYNLGFNIEYEDLFQDNCLSYTKAMIGYDAERGITFSAYMGRAIYNQFNNQVEKMLNERSGINTVLVGEDNDVDDIHYNNSNNQDGDLYNHHYSMTVEDKAVLSDEIRGRISKLSSLAKLVIRELISPSEDLLKTREGIRAHAELARSLNKRVPHVPQDVNLKLIRLHYALSYSDMKGVKREFSEKLGVQIA